MGSAVSTIWGRMTMSPSAMIVLAVLLPCGTRENSPKSRNAPKTGAMTHTTMKAAQPRWTPWTISSE